MRLLFLLLFCGFTAPVLAQYGTSYAFTFVLTDSAYQFDSEEDAPQVRFRERRDHLRIEAGKSDYFIRSPHALQMSSPGYFRVKYFVVPGGHQDWCRITIIRKAHHQTDTMQLTLHALQDEDFGRLTFRPGPLELDLTFGKPINRFSINTDTLPDGRRDLTNFLNQTEQPTFSPTPYEVARIERRTATRIASLHAELKRKADSLIDATFPYGWADKSLELTCAHSYCSTAVPDTSCSLTADSTCHMAIFTYRFSEFDDEISPLKVTVVLTRKPYFTSPYQQLSGQKVKPDRLWWLSPAEMRQRLKSQHPGVQFSHAADQEEPLLHLTFQAAHPMDSRESFPPEEISSVTSAPKHPWEPRFVYLAYSEAVIEMFGEANVFWYFDACTGELLWRESFPAAGLD